jgi:hypothetical protein
MKHSRSLLILVLFTLAFAGCSKSPAPALGGKLGIVNLSNGIETERDLGRGRICRIKPTMLADGSVLLELHIVKDGKDLASPRMQTNPDQQVKFSAGDISVELTPHIVK